MMLWNVDEGLLFLAAIIAFIAAIEIAFRLGRRHSPKSDDVLRSHVGGLQAALLGLLALLLGFNFAMAVARFDARKVLLQEEVSAINTTYLRAQLLAPREREEVTGLLKTYVDTRVDFMNAVVDNARIDTAIAASVRIETQLWGIAGRLVEQGASAVSTGLFIQSVNEMINVNEKRRAALDNHVPETVLQLLCVVALVALGFIAYAYGLSGRPRHGSILIFAVLISVVLTIIIDLDRPRRGLIRVSDEGMVRLQETLERHGP
ncbi:MAG TPA: hypothetical protein VGH59_16725 [Casimicrobiaceae bacterium]|jgi:hypothetical protein